MKKKNGFTLIELLAVIVILAIIALIAVPQILKILNKARLNAAKDSTYGIVKAAETYATNFMLENNGSLPHDDIEFACDKNGCNLITELAGYNLTGLSSLSFKGTKPTSGKVIISNGGKEITADLTINSFKCIYPSSDGTAECEGTSGDTPVTPPTKPELIKPTATPSPDGWSQSKTATVNFIGEGTYLVMPTVNVTTNIESITCRDVEDASFTCDGEIINTNGILIAKTWYKVNSNPTLTMEENGSIYYKVSDGTNYKDGGSLTITEIDRTAPTVASVTQKSATTNSITVTASGADSESNIVGYQFSIDNGAWLPSEPQPSNEYTFTGLINGNHQIKARVINGTFVNDGQNELNTKESITQTITNPVYLIVDSEPDGSIIINDNNVNINGINLTVKLYLPNKGYSFDWSQSSISGYIKFCNDSSSCTIINSSKVASGIYTTQESGYVELRAAGNNIKINNLQLNNHPTTIMDNYSIANPKLSFYIGQNCTITDINTNGAKNCSAISLQNGDSVTTNLVVVGGSPQFTRQISINGGEWQNMSSSAKGGVYIFSTPGIYTFKVRSNYRDFGYSKPTEEFTVTVQ